MGSIFFTGFHHDLTLRVFTVTLLTEPQERGSTTCDVLQPRHPHRNLDKSPRGARPELRGPSASTAPAVTSERSGGLTRTRRTRCATSALNPPHGTPLVPEPPSLPWHFHLDLYILLCHPQSNFITSAA